MTEAPSRPRLVRVSMGTEVILGLRKGRSMVEPTTAYLLTHHGGKCAANCAFCTQARESTSEADMLSRVVWPPHPVEDVAEGMRTYKPKIQRICIQTIIYNGVHEDVLSLARVFRKTVNIPISVSSHPMDEPQIRRLAEAGVERVMIPIDAATEEVFDKVKGKTVKGLYTRDQCIAALRRALKFFGKGKVGSYFIIGLGETEKEAVEAIQELKDMNVFISLFAFTPIPGILLQKHHQPSVETYRKIQLAEYLITENMVRVDDMRFNSDGALTNYGLGYEALRDTVMRGAPFVTRGCPGCNRPYYNEPLSGPLYNYPRPLNESEILEVEKMLNPYIRSG